MRKRLLLRPLLALADTAILAGAFQLAYWLRFQLQFLPERPAPPFDLYFKFSFLVALIGFSMLHGAGLYRLRRLSFGIEEFFAIFRAITFTALIVMAMIFVLRGYLTRDDVETYSRLIVLISWGLSLVLLTLWRTGCSLVFKQMRQQGKGLRNVVIVGTDQIARGFHRAVQQNVDFEYRPLGFVSNGALPEEKEVKGLRILGEVKDLPEIFRTQVVNEVVLACMDMDKETVTRLIKACERADVQFSMIPGFFEILTRQMRVQEVADIPIFQLEERIFQRWGRLVKRGMDLSLSFLVLFLFAPFWGLVALAIKLGSRGPIIFKHERVGKGERIFAMYKFRSMYADAEGRRKELEQVSGSADALLRLPLDDRVTPLGRLLRRFSIDEIPQLLNVLKGEMSLVGPRPHMPSEVARYQEWHLRKFDVLPGVTGLTQVSGRKDLSLDDMVRLDIYYIENWSPWLDLQILLKTVPAVLLGKGAY
jgi:exopolysaccharide biosynthesis polyprenyl glycosylphosphotransferase